MAQLRQLDKGRARVRELQTGAVGAPSRDLQWLCGTVAYTDSTAKTLGQLPAGAIPVMLIIHVSAAFNDTGTDTLAVGKTGTAGHFCTGLDVSATGQKAPTFLNGGASVGTSAIAVIGTYSGQNANASAGSAYVALGYVMA